MSRTRLGLMLMLAAALIAASGCGIFEQVGSTVNFASETTAYMNELTEFGQSMNEKAQQAMTDLEAKADLKQQIADLKKQIANYEGIQVPEYAQELYQSIVQHNETLKQGLDSALTNIEQGKDIFASTGIPDVINRVNELLGQINSLAP
ncbi:DUF6376 family protein [Paenibacillus sp. J5C_2022]|uniref:DUF6376 family protein n=1 Tax=Paenibacillus sp. J5C2022 TaxID=2977129 RepID=UPI0021CFDE72|nr:DUF6376 family protein [Paenibacillus sp. J5C2022]MCU6707248.1 DUF6376 family protein [Paenibacillus sp. J5C2022]